METKMEKGFPAPLFRDTIFDGASDPTVIWNKKEACYYMFYTQRRSTSVQVGFSSIHGSKIGVATSTDKKGWLYRGTLENLDIEHGHNTFWAPEILEANGTYHMYVSYITGIPTTWEYPRHILHYTSENLWDWTYQSTLQLSSERVIDACVYEVCPGVYKMWYKDENHDSHIYAAQSTDLYKWEVVGEEISDCSQEGPNVFELGGKKWMICDCWKGLSAYVSDDFINWKRCPCNLLVGPGKDPSDQTNGHHADILVENGEAEIYYFTGQYPEDCADVGLRALTAVQGCMLYAEDDKLCCVR